MSKPTFNLLGEIVADDSQRWFESDVIPAMLIGWLAKQSGDVEININSPGGDATAGIAMANAIAAYDKGKVSANVLGIAASAASIVACAADEVRMGEGAFLMIHNPWTITMGEADDLRHSAEVLDKMRDSLIGFYQSKTSKSADELKVLLDAETWLNFDDAVAQGFKVEKYTDDFKVAACATRSAMDGAPEAARRFFSAVPSDWSKRFSGLQAAKDKEIAALSAKCEDLQRKGVAACAAMESQMKEKCAALEAERDTLSGSLRVSEEKVQQLTTDLDAKNAALDAAKADAEQLRSKCAETEKALAETQAALAAETERYRAQVGAAMQPAPESDGRDPRQVLAALPMSERAAYYAAHKAEIDGTTK